tara:strand:+ start:1258 stop:1539 length:282 start_codon:yes stop_codon:yes gene_type:complete
MEFICEMNNMNKIEKKLIKLETQCNTLEMKLDKIIELLTKNTDSCEKMSEHIDFVETVYENVKNPLGFICNKINSMITGTYSLDTKKNNNLLK